MFNLFKSKQESTYYPQIVEEIHNKFNGEADRLLNDAKQYLQNNIVPTTVKTKTDLAKELGFKRVKEVTEVDNINKQLQLSENSLNAVLESIEYLPSNKWIPFSSVERICKEYNLILGEVSRFLGFVPEKNLREIEKFKVSYSGMFNYYTKRTIAAWAGMDSVSISKQTYDAHIEKENRKKKAQKERQQQESDLRKLAFEQGNYEIAFKAPIIDFQCKPDYREEYSKKDALNKLMICAPIKEMDMTGKQLDGVRIVKHIPDPIVLVRKDFNNIEGYYIITAWGDEANDYEVKGYRNV